LSVEEFKEAEKSVCEQCPLKRWNEAVVEITHMQRTVHLKEAYIALVEKLRQQEIDTETDRYEFLKVHPRCGNPTDSCC